MTNNRILVSIIMSIVCVTLTSCPEVVSCTEDVRQFERKEVNIIVLNNKSIGREFFVSGIDPRTMKTIAYRDNGGFYIEVRRSLQLGDTLVKNIGENFFEIKKAKSNIRFIKSCDGSNYAPVEIYAQKKLAK
ncbi:hypothetical protein [Hymenobacter elongatus]|uniref:Uncharacterized protein n=1 Tax=Hymenobacter elongatus TaxID=877208 RepID=A0A4Z0PNZ7_9BACT|nr:hypothetical protein [Hymenobacter elongatus]TGE18998.1 hypothetical protein E5J99_04440 [Hymenobacter elongatus]